MEINSKSYLSILIPQIAESLTKSNNIIIPDKCPSCGEPSEIIQLKEGKALYCNNNNCKAKIKKSIVHFVSRNCMNIEGFSEATIEKFLDNNFIKNYIDIYLIERFKEEIIEMKGFGEKSYTNLINSIENSKKVSIVNFIHALGIDTVGLNTSKLLCKYFNFNIKKIKSATYDELIEIVGFGEATANSIIEYFNNKENLNLLNKALELLTFTDELNNTNITKDITVAITGKINRFKNRNELKNKLEILGINVTNQVTSKTSYLINNDIDSTSGKNKKARELNIKIISEEEAINIFKIIPL